MLEYGYQIGEASKITGISKDTLHFYIKSGLITPDYIDPQNHYSYFSRWNMYQLDIITTCRRLGIPLEKVKQGEIIEYVCKNVIIELFAAASKHIDNRIGIALVKVQYYLC